MNDDMIIQLEHVINTIKCANHALAEIPGMLQYRARLISIIGDLGQDALAVTGGVLLMQQLGYIIKT